MEKRNILFLICFVFLTFSCATARYNPCGGKYSWGRSEYYFLYGFETVGGETIVEPKFTFASNFSEGFALFCESIKKLNDRCGFIDKTGRYVFSGLGSWLDVSSYSEGLASVKKGEKYGFMDKTGKSLIPPSSILLDLFQKD